MAQVPGVCEGYLCAVLEDGMLTWAEACSTDSSVGLKLKMGCDKMI